MFSPSPIKYATVVVHWCAARALTLSCWLLLVAITAYYCCHGYTEVVKNKENLSSTYSEPGPPCKALQDKACSSPTSSSNSSVSKSLSSALVQQRVGGRALTDGGNLYTEPPPASSLSSSSSAAATALRRCQSLLDTATTTATTGPLSWQRQAPAVTSRHSTCE